MSERNQVNETLASGPQWAVSQCKSGCVHLRMEHLTLTFSPFEFAQLVQILGEAYVRLTVRTGVASLATH